MRKIKGDSNFIIYLCLVIFLITAAGYGLGEECQVFSSFRMEQNSAITVPTLTTGGDLHTFQVGERNSVTLRFNGMKSDRTEMSVRGCLLFLCVLAILSVFFRLIQEIFVHFRRLYVEERFYVIFFMQDMDGRKRFS